MSDSVLDIGVWIGLAPSRLYRESMSQIYAELGKDLSWYELPTLLERNARFQGP